MFENGHRDIDRGLREVKIINTQKKEAKDRENRRLREIQIDR